MKTNQIFLDMDGVANNSAARRDKSHICYPESLFVVDPAAVELLNDLVEETNADVILSSTWRVCETLEHMNEVFKYLGLRFRLRLSQIPKAR